jgi:pyruvate formate lyase activating enzyme
MKTICKLCPHACALSEGQTGFCRARKCVGGKIISLNYGRITSLALDPIEKKPFAHYLPGSKVLSVGSFGCNLSCPFCQNYKISMADEKSAVSATVKPEELASQALRLVHQGNIGLAYTYNEPFVGFEYVLDCCRLVKQRHMKNILVTNGYINLDPLMRILPYVDAMNIDLKCFSDEYYKKLGGDLETVKNTIRLSHGRCHVEITTLIIPGENDSETEMDDLAGWLAGIDKEIPLHLSRFFPQYKYTGRIATPVADIERLVDIAKKHLKYVYKGNC